MYTLYKILIVALFSGANLLAIIALNNFWIENVYGIIFASSIITMTLCSLFISEFETAYLVQAIKNLQIMNKQIATKIYKRNHTTESLEKMSKNASKRKRDKNGKFI